MELNSINTTCCHRKRLDKLKYFIEGIYYIADLNQAYLEGFLHLVKLLNRKIQPLCFK